MKRTHLVPVGLVLSAMAVSFVALASPASAAAPCVAMGEYYTFAQQCAPRGAESAWLVLPMLVTALLGGTVGLVSLRRHLLRRDWHAGRFHGG